MLPLEVNILPVLNRSKGIGYVELIQLKEDCWLWQQRESFMALNLGIPKFDKAQLVSFVGGEGVVCGYKTEAGQWTYLIEMTLGPEPPCGRVGAETMVFMHEADLHVRDDQVILYESEKPGLSIEHQMPDV